MNPRSGWWSDHPFRRHSVERDVEISGFCGWRTLSEILREAREKSQQAHDLILTEFKLGGRVREVLQARGSMFSIRTDSKTGLEALIVQALPLGKRFKKIGEFEDEKGRTRWLTEPVEAYRSFGLVLDDKVEPFSRAFADFVINTKGLLFPSRYKRCLGKPITRTRAYQILREVGQTKNLWLYNHLIRAWRASQLHEDYGWEEGKLMEWFRWTNLKTATIYAKRGVFGLVADMKKKG